MLKQASINMQKQALSTFPLNPYELTENGIRDLRRNTVLSVVSFAACLGLTLAAFRLIPTFGVVAQAHGLGMMFLLAIVLVASLLGSLWVMSKSSDALMATGLFWRANVSDELQDEWEIARKRESYAKAYEYVLYGVVLLFLGTLAVCGVHKLVVGTLPPAPRFGTWVVIASVLIYIASVAPMLHLALTLQPIEGEPSETLSAPRKPQGETPLSPNQKRLKWLWQWGPVVIGVVCAVVFSGFYLG